MARPRTQAPRRAARSTMVKSKDRATSSVAARRAVLKRIKDEGVEHILFWFTDLEGHSQVVRGDAIRDGREALNDGMGFDGSSITGFNAIEESDMVAIPDPASLLMPRPEDDHGHPIGANVARMTATSSRPTARRTRRTRATSCARRSIG